MKGFRFFPVLLFSLSLWTGVANAQYDREFWFAAPDNTTAHCDNPILLRFITGLQSSKITVSQPANPAFVPISINIAANQNGAVNLSPYKAIVECMPANTVLDHGLLITATTPVKALYEVACNNTDIFILKGRHALGMGFVIPIQKQYNNGSSLNPMPVSSFAIVATEDNTLVTILPSQDVVGHPAGIPYTIVLDRGQTYAAAAVSNTAAAHLGGSEVTADKPVAVTLNDDSVHPWSTCLDLLGDQLIPENRLGMEYSVLKGFLPSNADRIYVYGTVANTSVYLNGNPVPVANINRGQYYTTNLTTVLNYIRTDQPVYVTHITGFGCEAAQAIVPPLTCSGSTVLSALHTSSTNCWAMITVPAGAEGSFTVNGNATVINASDFSPLPGTAGNYLGAVVNFTAVFAPALRIENSTGKFQLALLTGASAGSSYGFYSSYVPFDLDLGKDTTLCPGQTLELIAGNPGYQYLWQDGSTAQTFMVSQPGRYTVTVSSPDACMLADSIDVMYHPAGTITWNTVLSDVCSSEAPLVLSGGLPAGGTYSGTGVSGGLFDPAVGAGTHTLLYEAVDGNSCLQGASNTITVHALPVLVYTSPFPSLCIDSQSLVLDQGSPPGGTYSGPGVNAGTFSPALAGVGDHGITYAFSDANGCTDSITALISVHPLPDVSFEGTLENQCISQTSYILSGGLPLGGTYAGNGVSNGEFNASLTSPGVQVITYTYIDVNNCQNSAVNTIEVHALPVLSLLNPVTDICIDAAPLALTGGMPEGGYYTGNGVSASVFSPSIAGIGPHTLTYHYSDAFSCSDSISWILNVRPLPVVSFPGSFPPVCLNAAPYNLNTALPAGGTYSGPGVNGAQFDPFLAGPGVHTITYTYANQYGCQNTATKVITVKALPQASAAVNPVDLCEGEPIQFSGGASGGSGSGYTYQWTGPASFITNLQNPQIVSPVTLQSGTYSLVVRDGLNCVSPAVTVNVLIRPRPLAVASLSSATVCAGTNVQISGSATGGSGPAYLYFWTGPNSFSFTDSSFTLVNAQPSLSGTYSLMVIDNAGCQALLPSSVVLTVNALPGISANSPAPVLCEGNSLQLNSIPNGGSGFGYQFTWSGPDAFFSTAQNPLISNVSLNQSGLYQVIAIDNNGCQTPTPATVNVTVHPRPTGVLMAVPGEVCQGDTIQFSSTASGGSGSGYTFFISGPGGFSASQANPTLLNAQLSNAGTYSLLVTDGNNCALATPATVVVAVNPLPQASAQVDDPVICAGFDLQFTGSASNGTPPYFYAWSGPGGFSSSLLNPLITSAQPWQSGTYSMTVTDSKGCSTALPAQANAQVNALPVVVAGANQSVLCQGQDFILQAQASGGSGSSYGFQWTGPDGFSSLISGPITLTATNTGSGYYVVHLVDGNDCQDQDSVQITVNPTPQAYAESDGPLCAGETLHLSAFPAGMVSYLWNGPLSFSASSQSPSIAGAQANASGLYYLTVTNSFDCQDTTSVSVLINPLPLANAGPDQNLFHGMFTTLDGSVSACGSNCAYQWQPAGMLSGPSIILNPQTSNLTATQTYWLVATNEQTTCTGIADSVTVFITGLPLQVNPQASPDTLCQGSAAQLQAQVAGGNPSYTYTWSPAGSLSSPTTANPTATPSATTTYNLTVSDGYNEAVGQTTVVVELPVLLDAGPDTIICAGASLWLTQAQSTNHASLLWETTGDGTFSDVDLLNPVYVPGSQDINNGSVVLILTASGLGPCPDHDDSIVVQISDPKVVAGANQTVLCQGQDFILQAQASGGIGSSYGFQWTGPDGFSSLISGPITLNATNTGSGFYVVHLVDGNDCQDQDSVLITVNPTPQAFAESDGPLCAGETLHLSAFPAGMASYLWNGPLSFSASSQSPSITGAQTNASGLYYLTVTNSFDCQDTTSVSVLINPLPLADAGPDQNLFYGMFTNLSGSASACGSNCAYQWQPAGMLSGSSIILNPQTTNLTATQTYWLVVTNEQTACTSIADSVTVFITGSPLQVNPQASPDTLCQGSSAQLQAQVAGGNPSYTYTWSPAGSLSNATIANPIATPSATTTYNLTVSDGYNEAVGQTTVVVELPVLLDAGPDTVICAGASLWLLQAQSTNYASLLWETTGDGTFSDVNLLDPVYIPGSQDIDDGSVVLILTASGLGPCPEQDDSIVVQISAPTIAYAGPDDTICSGESYSLQLATVYNASAVAWTSGGTGFFSDTGVLNPVYYPSALDILSGEVQLSLHATNPSPLCGDSTHSMILVIKPLPNANAGPDVAICFGDTVQLQASGGTFYAWSPATGLSSTEVADPLASPAFTTTYAVQVTALGCSLVDSVRVTVMPLPVLQLSPDGNICPGDSSLIWVNGAHSYLWSNGSTDSTSWVKPPYSMVYTVTGTTSFGCQSEAEAVVYVYQSPVLIATPAEADICKGDFVILKVEGAYTYAWLPVTGLSSPSTGQVMASPPSSLVYTVTGTSQDGCQSTIQIPLRVYPKPVLSLPDTAFLCKNEHITLNSGWNSGLDYLWQDGSTSQFLQVVEPGVYWVVASNAGCSLADTCHVLPCADLWVPSAFTPDGNGLNDIFLVKSSVDLLEYQIYIFNRWGERVYQSDDIFAGWDGKFKDAQCGPGVFVWLIYYKSRDAGKQQIRGTLTLMR